jgi:hypothetical protein
VALGKPLEIQCNGIFMKEVLIFQDRTIIKVYSLETNCPVIPWLFSYSCFSPNNRLHSCYNVLGLRQLPPQNMSPSGSLTKTILRLTGENPGCARRGSGSGIPTCRSREPRPDPSTCLSRQSHPSYQCQNPMHVETYAHGRVVCWPMDRISW